MSYRTDKTEAATCDALLMKSNRIYQEIDSIYQRMMVDFSGSALDELQRTTDTLKVLFKNAFTIDSMIADSMAKKPVLADFTITLIGQRDDLLASLYQTNRHLAQKAENVKSLLRHELSSMATNRTALNGYKKIDTERKNVIRQTF